MPNFEMPNPHIIKYSRSLFKYYLIKFQNNNKNLLKPPILPNNKVWITKWRLNQYMAYS